METRRRSSRQRTLVYEAVHSSHQHPNAEEVYEVVRQQLPEISLGTVYRNLNLLEQMGMIIRIQTSGRADRFDADITPHPHLICTECGGVVDLDCDIDREMQQLEQALKKNNVQVRKIQLRIWGLCDQCNKQIKSI